MPPFLSALWPLLLICLQSLVSYLVGQRIFESLLLVGLRQFCKRWPHPTVIELTIAWADAVGKRHLLGDLQMPEQPPVDLPAVKQPPPSQRGYVAVGPVLVLLLMVLVGAASFWAGVEYGKPVPVVATAEAAKALPGGGQQLASQPSPEAKPAQPVPKGAKVQRTGQVKVKPKAKLTSMVGGQQDAALAKDGTTDGAPLVECPEVTIDYTLIRRADGQERMLTSSPDGVVVDGFDSAVATATAPHARPWAIGPSIGIGEHSGQIGVALQRELGPFFLGADVFLEEGSLGGRVRALIPLK